MLPMRKDAVPKVKDSLNEAYFIQCLAIHPEERLLNGFEMAEWATLLSGKMGTGAADINPTTILILREPS